MIQVSWKNRTYKKMAFEGKVVVSGIALVALPGLSQSYGVSVSLSVKMVNFSRL